MNAPTYSRSPRWSSGCPRVLLELVLRFESLAGIGLSSLFAKIKIKGISQVLRAPSSVGRRYSMRVDERKETGLTSSRDKNEGTYRSGEGREEPAG